MYYVESGIKNRVYGKMWDYISDEEALVTWKTIKLGKATYRCDMSIETAWKLKWKRERNSFVYGIYAGKPKSCLSKCNTYITSTGRRGRVKEGGSGANGIC